MCAIIFSFAISWLPLIITFISRLRWWNTKTKSPDLACDSLRIDVFPVPPVRQFPPKKTWFVYTLYSVPKYTGKRIDIFSFVARHESRWSTFTSLGKFESVGQIKTKLFKHQKHSRKHWTSAVGQDFLSLFIHNCWFFSVPWGKQRFTK